MSQPTVVGIDLSGQCIDTVSTATLWFAGAIGRAFGRMKQQTLEGHQV